MHTLTHMHTLSQSSHLSRLAESGWEGSRAENKGEETVRENSRVFTVVLANLMWQSEKKVSNIAACVSFRFGTEGGNDSVILFIWLLTKWLNFVHIYSFTYLLCALFQSENESERVFSSLCETSRRSPYCFTKYNSLNWLQVTAKLLSIWSTSRINRTTSFISSFQDHYKSIYQNKTLFWSDTAVNKVWSCFSSK